MSGVAPPSAPTKNDIPLAVDGLELVLRHYPPQKPHEHTVLLLHGGNTNSGLFHEPNGGLVRYLVEHGINVWTLDWRGSEAIVGPLLRRPEPLGGSAAAERALYTIDRVAEKDIPLALREMRSRGVEGDISVLGFCLGGASLAMSVARGHLETFGVGNVVLVTVGLFFEVPWNGWIKAEDHILERLLADSPGCRGVDPAAARHWLPAMKEAYRKWPKPWLGGDGDEAIDKLFRNLTFMYGEPYARGRLTREFERRLTRGFFGPIHMGLFLHASQAVRRGYLARFDELDIIDRPRIRPSDEAPADEKAFIQPAVPGDLAPEHFRTKRVTVLAGADDRLWHRDSLDLMYEWLKNEATPRGQGDRHRKHVLSNYGHLDLFWCNDAERDVYPLFREAIEQPPWQPELRRRGVDLECERLDAVRLTGFVASAASKAQRMREPALVDGED